MYVRAVRFANVNKAQMDTMLERIKGEGGPPPGVVLTSLQALYDEDQGTAVVLQNFATADDMHAAARIFDAMDASETPGARVSVDTCEVKLEL